MRGQLTHEEIRELLGAYALDAIESSEKAEVDSHLPTCPACRAEVDEHVRAAVALAQMERSMGAPEGLWQKIQSSVEEAPPPLVTPRGKRAIGLKMAGGFAAAAAVLIAFLGARVMEQDRRIRTIESLESEEALMRAAEAASANPTAQRIALRSSDEQLVADVVVLPDGTGYLVRHNLPALPPDRTYQLWALADGLKISLGVLGRTPNVAAFRARLDASAFAITEEVAGGVAATHNDPVVVGFVKT